MGRDPIGVAKCDLESRNKWLDKSDMQVFVNFATKLEVSLQKIISTTVLVAIPCFTLSVVN